MQRFSRSLWGIVLVLGLAMVLSFQNCVKTESGSDQIKSCLPPNCVVEPRQPSPRPSRQPSPAPSPASPSVSPSPNPSPTAGRPVITSFGLRRGSQEIPDGGIYSHGETITMYANANNATHMKFGNDSFTCTGNGSISCSRTYENMDINHVGFYGQGDFVASHQAQTGIQDTRKVASQCFSLWQSCKYIVISNASEAMRPRTIGIFPISREMANCSKPYEEDQQGASGSWDRSNPNTCFMFRAWYDKTQAADYECFYLVKDTQAEAMSANLENASRRPCDGGQSAAQLGVDSENFEGQATGWGAFVVRKISTGQADRIVYKTACNNQNCETTVEPSTHRRQNCNSSGSCTDL